MSMESTNVDISHLSIEQLRELLKLKENSSSAAPTASTSQTLEVKSEKVKPCSFIPKKANQQPCTELPNVNYGDRGFCKKHARTVQAINAKNSFVESQKPVEIFQTETLPQTVVEEKAPEKISEKISEKTIEKTKQTSGEKIEKVLKTASKSLKNETTLKSKKTPKIKSPTPNVVKRKISQNKWGRYEDEETSILFDPKTKAAYGIQDRKSGKVLPLNEKAIATCEKYKWKYFATEAESQEESSDSISEEVQKPQKVILKKKDPTPEPSEESSVEMPTPKKSILKKKVPTPEPSEEESSEPSENENSSEENSSDENDENEVEDSSVEDVSESLENESESVSEVLSETETETDQRNTEEASESDEKNTDDE